MSKSHPLFLYEEIMLLALRDEQGTVASGFVEYAVAGAVLAELLLERQISVEDSRRQLVNVNKSRRTGDPIIDECVGRMAGAKRRASLQTWVSRLAGTKNLRHKVARQLCDRGILRADEDKVLLIFSRKIYPELNPLPEKKIVARLRKAIFEEGRQLDPRTVVLVSLADGAGLLGTTFSRKEVRTRKNRIEKIVNGEITGKATKDVIAACQAALMVATITPIIISSSTH